MIIAEDFVCFGLGPQVHVLSPHAAVQFDIIGLAALNIDGETFALLLQKDAGDPSGDEIDAGVAAAGSAVNAHFARGGVIGDEIETGQAFGDQVVVGPDEKFTATAVVENNLSFARFWRQPATGRNIRKRSPAGGSATGDEQASNHGEEGQDGQALCFHRMRLD